MNDYLWDKKGEPDAEVERLEALLGAFAHEPRRLELPAEAATPEPRPRWRLPFTPRLFAPAALAAAAALLVASVLVASAFLRARVATRGEQAAAPESSRPKQDASRDERGMLEPPPPARALKDGGKVESAAVVNLPHVTRQRKATQPSVVPRRQRKGSAAESFAGGTGGGGLTLEAMSAPGGPSAFVENARLLTKEQLVYALRLTGAKLRDVRQKAQGTKAEARP
jgi:hypothetical protein